MTRNFEITLECDPVGEGTGDEGRGDNREHLLEDEVRQGRDMGGIRTRRGANSSKSGPGEVADDAAEVPGECE